MIDFFKKFWQSRKFLVLSQRYFNNGEFALAQKNYMFSLVYGGDRDICYEKKINSIDETHGSLRVAVSGWDLSHNAAGRVVTLAELYQYSQFENISIIGCVFGEKNKAGEIWEPIKTHKIPCYFISLINNDFYQFLRKAIIFVINNPFDIVHLSKPRITNLILGLLYSSIWKSRVIMDIDDEELAFIGDFQQDPNVLNAYPRNIRDKFWTYFSVKNYKLFDRITVSNPALQKKYGGIIIPHVRNEKIFYPSLELSQKNRKLHGITDEDRVVLFFGTPKRHKGILEVGSILAKLDCKNIIYMIVGDFVDLQLKKEVESIKNLRILFLPNQPYDNIKDIVSIGDVCILMQDQDSGIARYQLPAKLIDALAMGLVIFLQKTPATDGFISDEYVNFVNKDDLLFFLEGFIKDYRNDNQIDRKIKIYKYFKDNFSMFSYKDKIIELVGRDDLKICQSPNFEFLQKTLLIKDIKQFFQLYNVDL